MENTPRVFVYTTLSLTVGITIYLFTHNFFRYVENPGIIRYVTLVAFFIIYGNMTYVISRRFDSKALKGVKYPYILGLLMVIPTMLYIFIQPQSGVHQSQPILFVTLTLAGLIGAHIGIKNGLKKRNKFLSQLEGQRIPDSLKQSDGAVNNN